jgi:hypothetical protein
MTAMVFRLSRERVNRSIPYGAERSAEWILSSPDVRKAARAMSTRG